MLPCYWFLLRECLIYLWIQFWVNFSLKHMPILFGQYFWIVHEILESFFESRVSRGHRISSALQTSPANNGLHEKVCLVLQGVLAHKQRQHFEFKYVNHYSSVTTFLIVNLSTCFSFRNIDLRTTAFIHVVIMPRVLSFHCCYDPVFSLNILTDKIIFSSQIVDRSASPPAYFFVISKI